MADPTPASVLLADIPLEMYREAAKALDLYAIGELTGRSKDDPIYDAITEGRDRGASRARYSSCADRAHWKLYRLGVRERWINRAEHHGWIPGINISALAGASIARTPGDLWIPAVGDELLVWNGGLDAHSLAILEIRTDTLVTANYGAGGMSAASWPGARRGEAVLSKRHSPNGTQWFYGAKRIQRYLSLELARGIATARPSIPPGVGLTGEVIDALEGTLGVG